MSARRHISTRERERIYERERGVCHLCGEAVYIGQAWDVSHEIPLANGGDDTDENRRVAHRKCHRDYTVKVDMPAIAKSKRIHAKHIGAHQPKGRPMPGTRRSGVRIRFGNGRRRIEKW